MSLVYQRLRKHPRRSETTPRPVSHSQSISPATQWKAEEQGQVLRNTSLMHRSKIGSHLLNIYHAPDTVSGFTFHMASYLLFIAEEMKAWRG